MDKRQQCRGLSIRFKVIFVICFVAFIIILVSSVINYINGHRLLRKIISKEIIKMDATAAVDMKQETGSDRYQKAMKDEDSMPWGRDPFSEKAAIVGGDLAISDLKLEGILFHYGNVPRAIINGELVGEGDKIGVITVVKISKDDVIVTDGDKDYKLQLW